MRAPSYLKRNGAPADIEALKAHRLIGYVEEHAFSTALDYVRELYGGAPTSFESANAVTQLEAVRAGVGFGVVHDFIARRFKDLKRVLPERRATRAYWLVTHEDTRGLGPHPRRRRASGEGGHAGSTPSSSEGDGLGLSSRSDTAHPIRSTLSQTSSEPPSQSMPVIGNPRPARIVSHAGSVGLRQFHSRRRLAGRREERG